MKFTKKKIVLFTFLAVIFLSARGEARQKKYYFYNPQIDYGSEGMFNPFSLLLNGSYDVLRNGSHENNGETINIFRLDYKQGFKNVWDNISSPLWHINRYGWRRYLKHEIIPTSLDRNKAQWLPNYGHHIIGSGMLWVRTAEWFDYHGYSHPYWWSFFCTTLYQFMNETLENNHSNLTNVDPIADILIFNPLGFLVFSSEAVRRFFSETIAMYDWSLQPVFNPWNYHLENAGLQFTFKYNLSFARRYSLFFYYGIYGIGGLSYALNDAYHISFGAGTVVNRLDENIIRNSRFITPQTDGSIGFFIDRNHSLLTSLLITGPRMYNARINIYPGLIDFAGVKPGFFLGFGEWDKFVAGLTMARFPVGLLSGAD